MSTPTEFASARIRSCVGPTNSPPASATSPWPMLWVQRAAADALTRLEHAHLVARARQGTRGSETGQARANNRHVRVASLSAAP